MNYSTVNHLTETDSSKYYHFLSFSVSTSNVQWSKTLLNYSFYDQRIFNDNILLNSKIILFLSFLYDFHFNFTEICQFSFANFVVLYISSHEFSASKCMKVSSRKYIVKTKHLDAAIFDKIIKVLPKSSRVLNI